ncbi:MAG: PP2C family protein-serine/threonine phosphatase [Acidobacteriota bacterium]|jgi:sigma-B regulation protein RsbU (phosphoserine phosphatase)
MTTLDPPRPVNYRDLMKKVEHAVETIERTDDVGDTIHSVMSLIIQQFHDELGLFAGRIYRRHGDHFVLQRAFGEAKELPPGIRVPVTYEPVQILLDQGIVYMDESDPRFDRDLERELGVEQFAAIEVGENWLLAFNVAAGHHREDVLFSLGILRHSLNQKLRQERMESIFREARKIQASILPRRTPAFGPFEVFGRNVPVESVGGDFFDYVPLSDKILGIAIADVSGHGLPAALQTRDIYMGLRMGLGRDFKIVRTVERLNRIIHESTLTSRFVSMFYGELEAQGTFIYVNAGHPPPYHLPADGEPRPLEEGGAVLGPVADATYERGFVKLRPGDLLVLYTDGLSEARSRTREPGGRGEWAEYGVERLLTVAAAHRHQTAEEIVGAVAEDVRTFTGGRPAEDDRTLVVVRYPG